MGNYIGTTQQQQQAMLAKLNMTSLEELFREIPEEVKLKKLALPSGKSEQQVRQYLTGLAAKNRIFPTIFRGAGAYRHYIPAIVEEIVSKEAFVTAYTPYQAEISQGLLQAMFEYQTMICELTGMAAANASVYDGATAAAEAVGMCLEKQRRKVLLAATLHPMTIEVIKTYYAYRDVELIIVPEKAGRVDLARFQALLDEQTACLILQQPNYFGQLEDVETLIQGVHEVKGKAVVAVNPMTLALLKAPGEMGADIAVGEGQPLGLPLNFGGAYVGFMAVKQPLLRRLPGRIVGETLDTEGRRAFVLTLQAREQHIRREKAASNICSNAAHCALTVAVYLSAVGPAGLKRVAQQCYDNAHYLAQRLTELPGLRLADSGPFFHEFVTVSQYDDHRLLQWLEEQDILGGLVTERGILWCATEMNSKAEMDRLTAKVAEFIEKEAAV